MCYCSLNGKRILGGVRKISAVITPFLLFKWPRMSFALNNDPKIYQLRIANALYVYLTIGVDRDWNDPWTSKLMDVFTEGEAKVDL